MTKSVSQLSAIEWRRMDKLVKYADEDRWLSSRYAAREKRQALVALYAFNHELARIRLVANEPAMGMIRFQWWRDALARIEQRDQEAEHDVGRALSAEVAAGRLRVPVLTSLLDRHEKAFGEKDRTLEPEAILLGIAVQILASKHGWGQSIRKIAPAYAAARRGETRAFGPVVEKAPSAIRPATAHLSLRYIYARGGSPGALSKRALILRAMLTGKV